MNVFQYAAVAEANWKSNLTSMNPYKPIFTFYFDLAIAEHCEVYMRDAGAVKDTLKRIIASWGHSHKAMTELALVLNHKAWAFHDDVDNKYLGCGETWKTHFVNEYGDMYYEVYDLICDKWGEGGTEPDKEKISYFYSVID